MMFSKSFRALAERLGVDVDAYFERRYLHHRRLRSVRLNYDTGRREWKEDPRKIFEYYNDLKTKPSQETIDEATYFFLNLVKDEVGESELHTESLRVKAIAAWIDHVAVYRRDSIRWGRPEYWSSPFDLWKQYLEKGYFQDDCDGYSALMLWACTLIGVPEERLFMWAGWVRDDLKRTFGHATLVYDNPLYGMAHIEGSFYFADNQVRWMQYLKDRSPRYFDTWFMFNSQTLTH